MKQREGLPLIRTKMMIPAVREHIIHRQKLIDSIENGIQQGFILVSSPPGYGKTTLVADWAHQNQAPVAWLTLDEHDNDLQTLNRYLIVLMEKFFPAVETELVDFSLGGSAADNLQKLLVTLINRCPDLKDEFTLVLDDYHHITNPEIHAGLSFLLDHFPSHLRLIIATRSDPPFTLARLYANHHILEIDAQQLAFNLEETDQFLSQTVNLNLSAEETNRFFQRTEGWVTGLQLATLTYNEPSLVKTSGFIISSNASMTVEYMVDEVLQQQPERIQNFLLRTSILKNLYGPLCDYVVQSMDETMSGQDLVHSLYHLNLFLIPLDQDEHWFRYHSLFAVSLQHLLAEKYPGEIPTLYARASEWCDRNGYYEEALTYAGLSQQPDHMLALLEKYSIEAIRNGDVVDIISRIRKADENILSSSPILCMMQAWGYLLSLDVDSGEFWLDKARLLVSSNRAGDDFESYENEYRGAIAAIQSILLAARGDSKGAIKFSSQAFNYLPEKNSYSHSFALLEQGIMAYLYGDIRQALTILEDAIHVSQKSGNLLVLLISRINFGEILVRMGQLNQAMVIFQQALNSTSLTPGKFEWIRGYILFKIGEIFLDRNQLIEADQYMHQGDLTQRDNLPSLSKLEDHMRLARLYNCQGNYSRSSEEIAKARQVSATSQSNLDDFAIDMYEANFAILRGHLTSSIHLAQRVGILENEGLEFLEGYPYSLRMQARFLLARIYIAQGTQNNDAQKFILVTRWIENLLPDLKDSGRIQYQIEAYCFLALCHHALENKEEMLEAIKSALTLAEPEEFRQVFLDEGIPMARILTHYLVYMKQNKLDNILPTRTYVTDLLFRLTGKEGEEDKSEKVSIQEKEGDLFLINLLTARESEVLNLVARGCSNNEIALDLHISINTVKRHLNNAFMKLGVSTRTQAIHVAQRQGLLH